MSAVSGATMYAEAFERRIVAGEEVVERDRVVVLQTRLCRVTA